MKLHIRNMVCDRCILVVRNELESAGLNPVAVTLGEVTLSEPAAEKKLDVFSHRLESLGFELLQDKRLIFIERIKAAILELVQQQNGLIRHNLSDYLSNHLNQDYAYLSSLFSEKEGLTVEHYYIAQRIERAKELLQYNELTLSEIAYQLGFSSVAHLSNQFKKVTGQSPSQFKKDVNAGRLPLDRVGKK